MVEVNTIRHQRTKQHRSRWDGIQTTEFCFETDVAGKIDVDVKNGRISEHPDQRSLDTLPENVSNVICKTALLAHAHFNPRYDYMWSDP
jgi:hypothetical protein